MNPVPIPSQIAAENIHVRIEMMRHHFNERERLLVDWLLVMRIRFGQGAVRVARLDDLAQLLGTHRGHIHEVIAALHRAAVITVRSVAGGALYSVNTDTRSWKKEVRATRHDIETALETIKELNTDGDTKFFTHSAADRWALPTAAAVPAAGPVPPPPAHLNPDPEKLPELL